MTALLILQISAIFTEQQAAAAGGGPVPQQIARRMDGAMLAVGALSDILKHKVCLKTIAFHQAALLRGASCQRPAHLGCPQQMIVTPLHAIVSHAGEL